MRFRRMLHGVGWTLVAATALATVGGCGSGHAPTYRAGGTVTFADGTPQDGGMVEFQPVTGENRVSARGYIQTDGSFELSTFEFGDGAIAGEYRVLVTPPPSEGLTPGYIDPRFRQFETSGLNFVVSEDPAQNRFDIRVERGPTWGQAPRRGTF